ncbi:MAG: PQQ-binding-like beta-propeller repeat protein [Chloroflexota bacterium]
MKSRAFFSILIVALLLSHGGPRNISTVQAATAASEWTQFGHDAQRTHFNSSSVAPPWRLKWIWNGANASGAVSSGKIRLPRNSQPVTGNGRVYIAAGAYGVYAIDNATGNTIWKRAFQNDAILSTPAYDAATDTLYVLSREGVLYRLKASNGGVYSAKYSTGARSSLPLPPALVGNRVYFSMGRYVYAVDKRTMALLWRYDTGSTVETPPAYSVSRNRIVVVARNLFVHAINATDGTRAWRVKPTPLTAGEPGSNSNFASPRNGWPVIAEQNGIVFIRYRIDWQTLWNWSTDLDTNAEMRQYLINNPSEQALYALDLDNGAASFTPNVGNGGFGDGGYLPMGPLPVIKRFADNTEVAYVVIRGGCAPSVDPASCDSRWDSHLGEMVLDNTTVSGYSAGQVRFIRNTFFPTDEQPFLSMAGDHLFAAHWEAGIAHRILDRSSAKGTTSVAPITTSNLSHIATSQDQDVCGSGFTANHYCVTGLYNTRSWPGGFYDYWQQGTVYDQYWSEYASWVISGDTVYYVSTDGAIVALKRGNPLADSPVPTVVFFDDVFASIQHALRPEPAAVIGFQQAADYAGETVTVEGVLQSVFNNHVAVYLGFKNPHNGAFKVRITKNAWDNFEISPDLYYKVGMKIQVKGIVTWYQGDPVIYVENPSQIVIVDSLVAK